MLLPQSVATGATPELLSALPFCHTRKRWHCRAAPPCHCGIAASAAAMSLQTLSERRRSQRRIVLQRADLLRRPARWTHTGQHTACVLEHWENASIDVNTHVNVNSYRAATLIW
eukprot:363257-Chlamydomonas_euryale.AAC.15